MRKNLLYTLITLSLPFLILILIESSLRIFNYGETFPLFVEDPNNSNFLVVNEELSYRYFTDRSVAPKAGYYPFLKDKPIETFRIFVLGESTAAGFPYNHGASFPRQLEYLLNSTEKREVEVINLSMAAINSFTINDIVDEMLEQSPDHVLIYLGHNEYYGALGVGSSLSMFGGQKVKELYLKLKDFRIVQLIRNIFKSDVTASNLREDITLMERVVQDQAISKDSKVYQLGLNQFENNLDAILKKLAKAKINVTISNLVSNIKDQTPFGFDKVEEAELFELLSKLNPSSGAIPNLDGVELDYLKDAEVKYPNHAGIQFLIGRKLLALDSSSNEAVDYLIRAKDSDLIKFRAPSEINAIIKAKAFEYDLQFVDMTNFFSNSKGVYLPGYELFTEHLHPNLKGYRNMAIAFYSSFSDIPSDIDLIPTYTSIDSIYGELLILRLKESWPFKVGNFNNADPIETFKPKNASELLALNILNQNISWLEGNARLFEEYKKSRDSNMVRVATALSQEFRNIDEPLEMLVEANLLIGDTARAVEIAKPKFEIQNKESFGKFLGAIYLNKREFPKALSVYKKLSIINPGNNDFKLKVKAIEEVSGSMNDQEKYLTAPRSQMVGYLGAYLYLGLKREAQIWLDFLRKYFPDNDLDQFEQLIKSNS